MWTNRILEQVYLSLSADKHYLTTQTSCKLQIIMDKSVFARVLKVIIQCVEEGSALLQTFKMEGDVSNTRITIEFQSHETQAGAFRRKSDPSSGQSDDNQPRKHKDKAKDRPPGSSHGSTAGKAMNVCDSGKQGTVAGCRTVKEQRSGGDDKDNGPTDGAPPPPPPPPPPPKDKIGQIDQLRWSVAQVEKKDQQHVAGKDSTEKKPRVKHKGGVDLGQLIQDQNCIPPAVGSAVETELRQAIKQLDHAKKGQKTRNPLLKSKSLDEPASPTDGRTTPPAAGDSLPNGTSHRQPAGVEPKPKTVTFTTPPPMPLLSNNYQLPEMQSKPDAGSHDPEDSHGTDSSNDESDSDESLESVTDIRKFNMNQRKKLLKKRKTVMVL